MCAYKELRGELKSDTHTTHTQETVLPQPLPFRAISYPGSRKTCTGRLRNRPVSRHEAGWGRTEKECVY